MATRPAPRAGTGYIGLDQWLSLNRPQAAAMADSLVGDVNAQGQKAEDGLRDSREDFNYNVDSRAISFDPEQYATLTDLPDLEKRAAAVEKQTSGAWDGYKGLEDVASYGAARATANDAQRNANLLGDQYGRTALLQDKYGKTGGYTYGQQRLDSALAGAAGGDKIDATKKQWGGLLGKFDNASAAAKSKVANVQKGNAEAAKQYRDAATAGRANYEAELEKQAMASQREVDKQRASGRQQQEEAAASNRDAVNSGRIPMGGKGKTAIDDWADPGTNPKGRYRPDQNRYNYGRFQG